LVTNTPARDAAVTSTVRISTAQRWTEAMSGQAAKNAASAGVLRSRTTASQPLDPANIISVVRTFPLSAKATKHRLTKLTRHAVPCVLAGAAISENIPGHHSQAKGIIKLSIGEKPTVGSDLGTVKFQLQTAVEINPQRRRFAFTRRVTRGASVLMCVWH
jgi:hypothetical protein